MKLEQLFKLIDQDIDDFILKIEKKESKRRAILDIGPEDILTVSKYILEELKCRFVTATLVQHDKDFEIYYHFCHDPEGQIMSIHVILPHEKPQVESLSNLTESANWIEREMHELYGVEFFNHPEMKPLLSDENWEEDEFPYENEVTD